MPPQIQKITYAHLVPFLNERRKGANPSLRVTELPDFRFLKTIFVDQLCCFKLGISIPSLRTHVSDDRSHEYRKDRWRLHFYVCGHPSRAGNHYDTYNIHEVETSLSFFLSCIQYTSCIMPLMPLIAMTTTYPLISYLLPTSKIQNP